MNRFIGLGDTAANAEMSESVAALNTHVTSISPYCETANVA